MKVHVTKGADCGPDESRRLLRVVLNLPGPDIDANIDAKHCCTDVGPDEYSVSSAYSSADSSADSTADGSADTLANCCAHRASVRRANATGANAPADACGSSESCLVDTGEVGCRFGREGGRR